MLLAAAERGVKVNIIVFKEVPQFMYRKWYPIGIQELFTLDLLRFRAPVC